MSPDVSPKGKGKLGKKGKGKGKSKGRGKHWVPVQREIPSKADDRSSLKNPPAVLKHNKNKAKACAPSAKFAVTGQVTLRAP